MKEDSNVSLELFLGAIDRQTQEADVRMGRDHAPTCGVYSFSPGLCGDLCGSLGRR